MKRREFVSLVGSGAAVWPLAAWAQKPTIPVIGFINGTSPQGYGQFVAAFRRGHGLAGKHR
ncbi:hypothetical protein [Bradyrhizobium niftali]|jgi:putative ABC transport system substrate-binding protein|uniref:Uncharacterized protein n=1 Tax=Bradyrhizobium niftali TaxID=2560055 RepID=A0A4Y9LD38_9BRAD|nr:hypothetical protein [Bradyrhizobium niftali]TFV41308.1 hypothetical protein E4K65_37270 [Bradyrhizobium niftali]